MIDKHCLSRYTQQMIGSVRHKGLRRLIESGDASLISMDMHSRLRRMMSALHAAEDLNELETIPGWRLHPLKGDRKGYWSLSVDGNWRVVFKWRAGIATDVDFVDYH